MIAIIPIYAAIWCGHAFEFAVDVVSYWVESSSSGC